MMADVFLSYAREDKRIAAAVARSLEQEGFSVWWDPAVKPHQLYTDMIDAEIERAKALLVLWSGAARESAWVRSEATAALEMRKLVQARLDEARLPRPFDQVQAADLSAWTGELSHAERRALSASIRELTGRPAVARPRAGFAQIVEAPRVRPNAGGLFTFLGLAALAAGAAMVGYFYASSPTLQGFLARGGDIRVRVEVTVNPENVRKVEADVKEQIAANPDIF